MTASNVKELSELLEVSVRMLSKPACAETKVNKVDLKVVRVLVISNHEVVWLNVAVDEPQLM